MKLSLNKKSKGLYQKRSVNILVTVEQRFTDNIWVGSIEKMTHFAKDVLGNNVEMGEEIFTWKAKTKKEVCSTLTNYILNN